MDITHPHNWDWYMIPHSARRGTARPSHYCVLYDENNFTSDELQEFSHNLSYIYCRAPVAVSVIPPIYYAHLAGNRARSLDPISVDGYGASHQNTEQSVPPLYELADTLKSKMWWV
jgi:eukaryotic translation initiation factor 2C